MTPTFTVLIGACAYDRPDRAATLKHTLDSIARQERILGDQVIVVVDSYGQDAGAVEDRKALVRSYGHGFSSSSYDSGYHFFGVEQINLVLHLAKESADIIVGTHIITMGDDDVFVDGAYRTLRTFCSINPDRPVLYKFLAPWREVLWDVPRMQMSRISGCCIAAPRQFVGPMNTQTTWPGTDRPFVEHDYFWMQDILEKSGQEPLWLDKILVIARPDLRGDDVAHQGVAQCEQCKLVRYREDMTSPLCPHCKSTLDVPYLLETCLR